MKHVKKVNFLKVFLNICTWIFILLSISPIYSITTIRDSVAPLKTTFLILLSIIFLGCFLAMIKSLKNILNTILSGDPFVDKNVFHFRMIGFLLLFAGLIDAMINYPLPNMKVVNFGIYFLLTSKGSLKPIFFLYFVLGSMAFILGDVFKIAIDIKNDNNLTI